MIFTKKFIHLFSIFTGVSGLLYFAGESYFIYKFGQPHLQTLADLIAIILLLLGGIISLKNYKNLGILCGAWGFNFCINYRAWVWRYYAKLERITNNETDAVSSILLFLLLFSCTAFIITIILNLPKTKITEN